MGARCCCCAKNQVDASDLKEQLLDKDARATFDSTDDRKGHVLPSTSSISGSSYTSKNERLLVSQVQTYHDQDDDPFSSARDFVDERELSRSSSSREYDDQHSYGSVSSLNGTTPRGAERSPSRDSYTDSNDRSAYSSQVFDAPPAHGGWNI
ncbi:hypothetical protein SDRG_04445 [Saprolegnia diclina VS20]|uniref:Uncharacterized protein n=1 Tax=Saprolegnia diclina (strain VS20) TaxID=1156394 RepID=T0QVJ1_SAPDV|nr:hypothetical protein SDRG_04445 [Saprolegnia diclina VS20]EQC38015.1 hypothetical protein SDRG_04445 [Saprolegnia diclina VS20]|eukprot:XP_008608342.1 hypothetical protein SDRG_04445 [Saprolegnia diclina VS20]